jgi:hypothetical protein
MTTGFESQAIITLASQYGRYGYRRITALLKLAGSIAATSGTWIWS